MIAEGLRFAGHDAVHVRDLGKEAAADHEIFAVAENESRTLISADTDFGSLLAAREESKISVILFRRGPRTPARQLQILLLNLARIEDFILQGSIIIIEQSRIRVRQLPV